MNFFYKESKSKNVISFYLGGKTGDWGGARVSECFLLRIQI